MLADNAEVNRSVQIIRRQARRQVACPSVTCSGRLVLKRGRGRWFWGCTEYPICRETQSANQETGDPVGSTADRATQMARDVVVKELERLMGVMLWPAFRAIQWLAEELGMPLQQCDVATFNVATCRRAATAIRSAIYTEQLRLAQPLLPTAQRVPVRRRRRVHRRAVAPPAAPPPGDLQPDLQRLAPPGVKVRRRIVLEED